MERFKISEDNPHQIWMMDLYYNDYRPELRTWLQENFGEPGYNPFVKMRERWAMVGTLLTIPNEADRVLFILRWA